MTEDTDPLPASRPGPLEENTMRRNVAIVTGIAAGATALALVATPALAQAGPWSQGRSTTDTTCPMLDGTDDDPGTGYGMGRGSGPITGTGRGNGNQAGIGMGMGRGNGTGTTAPSGTLTADQKVSLAAMAEEEKLAQDLYSVLATTHPADVQFARISRSESMHLAAVRRLLVRYDVTDPTAGLASGDFASERTQALYDRLLASATSDATALAAGIAVEKDDIAALAAAKAGVTAPDVLQVYANLLAGSERHLSAFGG
jgi:hypothetical protein